MHISRLEVGDLRILRSVAISPCRGLNLIVGSNGTGKTSVLEGVYLLGSGRSFRTRHLSALIRRGVGGFRVFGEVVGDGGRSVALGLARSGEGMEGRVGGRRVARSSDLARELAVALVRPESHRLVGGGPGERRRLLDWGLFHVEPAYHGVLQRYGRGLRQRNAALRSSRRTGSVRAWDGELAETGEQVSVWRAGYVERLGPFLMGQGQRLLGMHVSVRYRRGWSEGMSLGEALERNLPVDRERGATSAGPQRADVLLQVDGLPVEEALSRGQAKLLVGAVVLSQCGLVAEEAGVHPVVLVDDLAAELDERNRHRFLENLAELGNQAFVTSVTGELGVKEVGSEKRTFHVEQGSVQEVV
jgi:DNA replication and repair protein RecF